MSDDPLDMLRAVVEQVLGGIDATCVFCAGSFLEGRATRNSDIDLIVITEARDAIPPRAGCYFPGGGVALRRALFRRDDRQIDAEYWVRDDVEDFLKSLEEFSGQPLVEYPVELIRLVHRISVGAPIVGEPYFHDIQSRDPVGRLAARLVAVHLFDFKSKLEDYGDWLRHDRERGTHLLARMALDHAVDAYLASRRRINPNPKWRLFELEEIDPALATDYYSVVENVTAGSGGSQRRAMLASTVAACAEIALPYQKLASVRAAPRRAGVPDGLPHAYLRQPASYVAQSAGGGLALRVISDRTWGVDLSGALVWILCDGTQDLEGITESIAALCSVGPEVRDQVRTALADFEGRGIVRRVGI
jgi:predicted nucleotidyltransferase